MGGAPRDAVKPGGGPPHAFSTLDRAPSGLSGREPLDGHSGREEEAAGVGGGLLSQPIPG